MACAAALAQQPSRPLVIELYTSQGCSSCPPAEALLGELADRTDVLPLAFHVDYWDDLGWRDRFALPAAAQQQHWWATANGLPGVFTPQLIIDGRRSVVGLDRAAVIAALREPRTTVAVQAVLRDGVVQVSVPERSTTEVYDVYAIAYLSRAETVVPRGENAGRTLTEWNIVRSWRRLGVSRGAAAVFTVAQAALPADATRVAIVLQDARRGGIAGAMVVKLQ
ncbi:MAG: DUF1223 domain-containing protein [Steroidobacteraceae bacterium]